MCQRRFNRKWIVNNVLSRLDFSARLRRLIREIM
jgi:hypothetical protein